jgi:hypothetical protein
MVQFDDHMVVIYTITWLVIRIVAYVVGNLDSRWLDSSMAMDEG